MGVIQRRWQELRQSPIQALSDWQSMRWLWLVSAMVALSMNLIAHYIFQIAMDMAPCERCVYIRYAMFSIVFGGLIASINPKLLSLRIAGYAMTLYGAIFGAIWSKELVDSYNLMRAPTEGVDPFAAGFGFTSCATEPTFHFGLPLDRWFPSWFSPSGICGVDDWSFLGLDMGSWTLIIFSVYIVFVILCLISALVVSNKKA